MPKATFINPDGSHLEVDAPVGESLMRTGTANGIDSILGDCGGGLACATCHVFVSPQFLSMLPQMTEGEHEMLDYAAAERREGSRLSCQIIMQEDLDGIVVEVADPQI